jgi:hypothetical protein
VEDLIPVTTYVPASRVVDFQQKAALWVANVERRDDGTDGTSRYNDRWDADQRPDWTTEDAEFAKFVHSKLANGSVSGRALAYMAHHPDAPLPGSTLAIALELDSDSDDVTGSRQIAGCWGHLGRYCEEWQRPLPFRWSEDKGYWVTTATGEVLKQAGF